MFSAFSRRFLLSGLLAGGATGLGGSVWAAAPLKMDFVTHAAFFSVEMKLPKTLDPQVFVRDPGAPEAVGPQGIKHVAGVRPPFVDQDPGTTELFTADNKPLGLDLKTWLGPKGTVTIVEQAGKVTLEASFTGLKPNGVYSIFENHFDQKPIGFTPMDGTAKANSFTAKADGSARVSMILTHVPTHDNAVLLVLHSDNQTHGLERGKIGVDAHHQLIARPS